MPPGQNEACLDPNTPTARREAHRSDLFDLFWSFKVSMFQEFQDKLKNHYKGSKRNIASNIPAGGMKLK